MLLLYATTIFQFLSLQFLIDRPILITARKVSSRCHRKNMAKNSFLWKIEIDPPSYFYGTIHVPYDMVWEDIPDNAKLAFERSHSVFFELDLTDYNTVRELERCQLLPNGLTLDQIIPSHLYKRLRRHIASIRDLIPFWLNDKMTSQYEVKNLDEKIDSHYIDNRYKKDKSLQHQTFNIDNNNLKFQKLVTLGLITSNTIHSINNIPASNHISHKYRKIRTHSSARKLKETDDSASRHKMGDQDSEAIFQAITADWRRKRPIWIMLMLNALTENDIRARGTPVLDLFLSLKADKSNKIVGAIERVEDQCTPLNDLNSSQVLIALNQTLTKHEHNLRASTGVKNQIGDSSQKHAFDSEYLDKLHTSTSDIANIYLCGNVDVLIHSPDDANMILSKNAFYSNPVKDANDDFQSIELPEEYDHHYRAKDKTTIGPHIIIDNYFRQELIAGRNKKMAERAIEIIKRNAGKNSVFFAFGAAHFLGNDTIINHVREAGFLVKHVLPHEPLTSGINMRNAYVKSKYYPKSPNYKFKSKVPSQPETSPQYNSLATSTIMKKYRYFALPPYASSHYRFPTYDNNYRQNPNFNDLWVRKHYDEYKKGTTYSNERFSDDYRNFKRDIQKSNISNKYLLNISIINIFWSPFIYLIYMFKI
ncbi:unnamed protein product [Gordionus sp. m RMFG-2023]